MRLHKPENRFSQNLQDATKESFADIDSRIERPFGKPTLIQTANYHATEGDMVRVDPSKGAFTVFLPPIDGPMIGKVVTVFNVSNSSNSITIHPSATTDKVNGGSYVSISSDRSQVSFICVDRENWVILDLGSSGSAGLTSISSTGTGWKYLSPFNIPAKASAPIACYQFDGTASQLSDRSGNGYTLTVENGSAVKTEGDGLKGIFFNGAFNLVAVGTSEALRATGAVTIEAIISCDSLTSPDRCLVACADGGGASLATNYLYSLYADFTTETWFCYHEYHTSGVGVPVAYDAHVGIRRVHYIALTRAADGKTHKIYANGLFIDGAIVGNGPQKDPVTNTQDLRIGNGDSVTSEYWIGEVFGVRITMQQYTDAQISEAYKALKSGGIHVAA